MIDTVEWTEAGKAELENEYSWGAQLFTHVDSATLHAEVAAAIAKYFTWWKVGADKSDAHCRPAIELIANTWAAGKPSPTMTVDQLAGMATLLGNGQQERLVELVVREHGIAFALRVLVKMWALTARSCGPAGLSLHALLPDDASAQDASGQFGKATFAHYLQRLHRGMSPEDRDEMTRAVDEIWLTTPLEARAPLALATSDRKRAAEIARDLADGKTRSHPHFAWEVLPCLIEDLALLARIDVHENAQLSLRFIETLGAGALPLYEEAFGLRRGASSREAWLGQLQNIRGPRTAKIFARFAAKHRQAAQQYFTRYPDLLDGVIEDPTLRAERPALERLRIGGRAPTPAKPKRRSARRGRT